MPYIICIKNRRVDKLLFCVCLEFMDEYDTWFTHIGNVILIKLYLLSKYDMW